MHMTSTPTNNQVNAATADNIKHISNSSRVNNSSTWDKTTSKEDTKADNMEDTQATGATIPPA